MKNSKKILAIIPARGGSKGIPRKNIKFLNGKPLISYTIEAALKSKYLDKILVSTDDKEIAEISEQCGAQVLARPKNLAQDATLMQPVLEHAVLNSNKPDIIILLHPTSPLRTDVHIDKAIDEFFKNNYDSLLSVCHSHAFIWRKKQDEAFAINYDFRKRINRQDQELEYKENGAIYITNYDVLMNKHNILDKKVGLYVMLEKDSIEVDTEFDFWLCENRIKKI